MLLRITIPFLQPSIQPLPTSSPAIQLDGIQRAYWKDNDAYEVKLKKGDEKIKMLVDANRNVIKQKM